MRIEGFLKNSPTLATVCLKHMTLGMAESTGATFMVMRTSSHEL